ncbi:hypothetical protein CMO91_06400 [Candidatus Woesearchaeota archaeon]|nr:hypothetical protein [Candidatus Woesearchaeota archaeon]
MFNLRQLGNRMVGKFGRVMYCSVEGTLPSLPFLPSTRQRTTGFYEYGESTRTLELFYFKPFALASLHFDEGRASLLALALNKQTAKKTLANLIREAELTVEDPTYALRELSEDFLEYLPDIYDACECTADMAYAPFKDVLAGSFLSGYLHTIKNVPLERAIEAAGVRYKLNGIVLEFLHTVEFQEYD